MKFDNSFDIPLPPHAAWTVLLEVERIVPCMPGAKLTEVIDGKNFKGTVSVRLGPVALTFEGLAQFETVDEELLTATVKAKGRDPKGRGSANATVIFHLIPNEEGSKVLINTDLTLSGSIAQYGRGTGMIQSMASQLISQFAEALEEEIASDRCSDAPAGENLSTAPNNTPITSAAETQSISGFSLLFTALGGWLKGLFGKS